MGIKEHARKGFLHFFNPLLTAFIHCNTQNKIFSHTLPTLDILIHGQHFMYFNTWGFTQFSVARAYSAR